MPRQNRRREPEPLRPVGGGATTRVQWNGRDFLVRHVAGGAAVKPYRCPGCDQEILPGVPHVVAWPDDDVSADDRRHWHSACWAARDNRRPTRR